MRYSPTFRSRSPNPRSREKSRHRVVAGQAYGAVMSTSIQPRFGFVIDYVDDVEASRRFYEEKLGIKAQRVHPTFVQFEHFAVAGDEPLSGTGESEVYWLVDD